MMVCFILCLLLALLPTTSAQDVLTCELCAGTAETCKNPMPTCTVPKATGGCMAVAEESTLDGFKLSSYLKACVDDYNSGIKVPVTFTVGTGLYLRINTERCNNADKCNSAALEVPKENTTPNGLQCPTCFSLNVNSCESKITPCTGDETYCIDFAGTLTRGAPPSQSKFAAQGCATTSAQDIKTGNILYSAIYTYEFTKATSKPAEKAPNNGGGSPALGKFSFALYLPGLTGLLLLKLLP